MRVRHNRKISTQGNSADFRGLVEGKKIKNWFFSTKNEWPQLVTAFRKFKDTPWDRFTQPPPSKNNSDFQCNIVFT